MIYTKLISGLGNQLFQYAIGRQLAINRGVPLKLDLSFYKNQNLRSFKLHHYNINATIASENEVNKIIDNRESNDLIKRFYRKFGALVPMHKPISVFREREWWVYEPDIFEVPSNTYIEGYWQHHNYFNSFDPSIFDELQLKEPFEDAEIALFSELRNVKSSVSVHIRRGDYLTDREANSLMGVLPLQYYHKAFSYIEQKVVDPHYYIFSDDLDWVVSALKINFPFTLVDIANGTKDYLELSLMSECRHNIIANSSFSWWGAFLNQNPDKIVIAPSKWVVPDDINSKINLQLPSWVKL